MSARYPLVLAVALAAAAPAPARAGDWRRVLRLHHVAGRSADVFLRPGSVVHRRVSFTIGVHSTAPGEISFADSLYGATAWVFRRDKWRRLDSAEVRAATAPSLEPGGRAHVRLPLRWHARRVRVLVRVPEDHRAAWTDVTD